MIELTATAREPAKGERPPKVHIIKHKPAIYNVTCLAVGCCAQQ